LGVKKAKAEAGEDEDRCFYKISVKTFLFLFAILVTPCFKSYPLNIFWSKKHLVDRHLADTYNMGSV